MTEHVKTEISDGVLTLTLQRPEKKNALTGTMYVPAVARLGVANCLTSRRQSESLAGVHPCDASEGAKLGIADSISS